MGIWNFIGSLTPDVREFLLIESDEPISIDLKSVVAVKKEGLLQENKFLEGVQLVTGTGAAFWIRGDYNQIRQQVFGSRCRNEKILPDTKPGKSLQHGTATQDKNTNQDIQEPDMGKTAQTSPG